MDKVRNDRPGRSYIAGLFGLRALAAIAVVSYHLFSYDIKGGYLGVCLFFVLSGFLLAGKGTLELSRREFSITDFYKKRLRRIYPALIIFIFVTYGALYFIEPDLIRGTRSELFAMIFGYHNWWQIAREDSYFSQITAVSPFRHIWSLAMEIQFYVIYPLVFFIFLSLLKRFKKKTALSVFGVLVALSAIPMTLAYLAGVDISRIYYGTDLRFFAILFGMFTGFLRVGVSHAGTLKARPVKEILTYVALALMLAGFLLMDGQQGYIYLFGMQLMCLIMCYLAFVIADGRLSITRVLEIGPLRWIGSRSYEIYLWHYPFVAYLHYHKLTSEPLYVIGAILASLIVAELAYRLSGFVDKKLFGDAQEGMLKRGLAAAAVILVVILGGFIAFTVSGGEKYDLSELARELEENKKLLEGQLEKIGGEAAVEDPGEEAAVTPTPEAQKPEGEGVSKQVDGQVTEPTDGQVTEAADGQATEPTDGQVPAPTETAEETVPLVTTDSMTIIGDSIALGASPQLMERFPEAYIDAEQSRQVRGSLDVIKKLDEEGHLGHTVIYFLGVNAPFLEEDGQEIVDYLGPDRQMFWVNAYGDHVDYLQRVNDTITAVCDANPNVHEIDWEAEALQHPDWFYEDGTHLNKYGQTGFADFLYNTLMSF